MEIIWARFPADDPQLNDDAWREIDETQIEPAVRRELANNGFRAGVIGGTLPDAIARALNQGEAARRRCRLAEANAADVDLMRRADRARPSCSSCAAISASEIQASEVYPSLPLLVSGGRELERPHLSRKHKPSTRCASIRSPTARRIVELTPELHYGAVAAALDARR